MSKEILILGKEAFDKLKPDVQRFIKQQSQHIADLMSKLAESEKQIKDAREAGNMAVDSWCKIEESMKHKLQKCKTNHLFYIQCFMKHLKNKVVRM